MMLNRKNSYFNFTGEIIEFEMMILDCVTGSMITKLMILPPLGRVYIDEKIYNENMCEYITESQIVKGLPGKIANTYFIVPEYIAKTLSQSRNDLVYISEAHEEFTENTLNPKEIKLVGKKLMKFVIDY